MTGVQTCALPIFPEIKNLTPVYFLDLRIFDKDKHEIDNSIYWLSVKKDILDYQASAKLPWPYYTPTKQYADYTMLDRLPEVKLAYDYQYSKDEKNGSVKLRIKNPSESIAFFLFFDLIDASSGSPVLPVYWEDNYVTLLPGEDRTYTATYFLKDSDGNKPVMKINGWNVKPVTLN